MVMLEIKSQVMHVWLLYKCKVGKARAQVKICPRRENARNIDFKETQIWLPMNF